jgi:hypothetical protein
MHFVEHPSPVSSAARTTPWRAAVGGVAVLLARRLKTLHDAGMLTPERNDPGALCCVTRRDRRYRTLRRDLEEAVAQGTSRLAEEGETFLASLRIMRTVAADAMQEARVRTAVQQIVLAEICVAAVSSMYANR